MNITSKSPSRHLIRLQEKLELTAKKKSIYIQRDTKKRKLLKNPTKIEEIQEKKLLTEIKPLQLAF